MPECGLSNMMAQKVAQPGRQETTLPFAIPFNTRQMLVGGHWRECASGATLHAALEMHSEFAVMLSEPPR